MKNSLHNARTATSTDPAGTNLGHTIPWIYEEPTLDELKIIQGDDFMSLKNLISKKRIFVNGLEKFLVRPNMAFTLEARLEDSFLHTLPNVFFYFIIAFIDGEKIVANQLLFPSGTV